MDEDAPAVVVEVTPRSYRTQGIVFVVGGLVLTAVSLWLGSGEGRSSTSPFVGVVATAYGVYCAVQARRQVTRTLLRIDPSGFRSEDGRYDQSWSGVVMVWVGSSTGLRLPLVGQPVGQPLHRRGHRLRPPGGHPTQASAHRPRRPALDRGAALRTAPRDHRRPGGRGHEGLADGGRRGPRGFRLAVNRRVSRRRAACT